MALSRAERAEVDRQVHQMMAQSASFAQLSVGERAEILENTKKVVEAMAEARRDTGDPLPSDPYAVVLAEDRSQKLREDRTAQQRYKEGQGFGAAIDKGVDQIARLIDEVGFPEFCAALIQGVFQSIVDTSIEQMQAYAEMVKGVTSSLNTFKNEHVSPNQGRDALISRYPRLFQLEHGDGGPRVMLRDDADTDLLPDFQADLGLDRPIEDLDEEVIETVLVEGARTDLARGRQQLLATLVLMGINRIVVTDGQIKAKVKFKFKSSDTQTITATDYDYGNYGTLEYTTNNKRQRDTVGESTTSYEGGKWTSQRGPGSRYLQERSTSMKRPILKLENQTDTYTESTIAAQAEMLGEVSINFKSETFPLERLVGTDQITQLQGMQQGGLRATPTGAGPAAPPATSTAPAA